MTELGPCIGKCWNLSRCFFGKGSIASRHLVCHNLAVELKRCVKRSEGRLTWPMRNDNDEEAEMSPSILRSALRCLRC